MSRFYIVDVFAEEKYAGNPLAVVVDGAGIPSQQMQRIALEMNYSETTFITGGEARGGGWDVRIFTPVHEIPFAGHPTLGTASVIRRELLEVPADRAVLHLGVGDVPVTFEAADGDDRGGVQAWMVPPVPEFGPSHPGDLVARVLGLAAEEIDPRFPVQELSTGISITLVPLRSLDAVKRAVYHTEVLRDLEQADFAQALFFFCSETEHPENQIHARMFAPLAGVPEDPATGSANACLAAYLVKHRYFGEGPLQARVEQGYEMGRPSLLRIAALEERGAIRVRVGGRVRFVARGELL
jgi:trans-2,3-dihydro-3-hydroxyanthranilate isomerase